MSDMYAEIFLLVWVLLMLPCLIVFAAILVYNVG